MALLDVQDVTIRYHDKPVVQNLSFSLEAGQTLALVGESGSGKSSTALAIAGLLPDSSQIQGDILLQGQSLLHLSPRQQREQHSPAIGMIFQEPLSCLNPVLRIGTQIIEAIPSHQALSRSAAQNKAIQLLEQVQLPRAQHVLRQYPHELSGGQRQRVLIAMAIARQPQLLIADEPTTALDVTTQAQILHLLDELKKELQMGLLLITHDLGIVSERADQVAVMQTGHLLEYGPTSSLFTQPKHPYSRGLLEASLRKDETRHYLTARLPELQTKATTVTPAPPSPPAEQAEVILRVEQLSKQFSARSQSVQAVNNVSFRLRRGETLGLVGQSGCGKSTLSKMLLRLIEPDQGNIWLNDQDLLKAKGKALRQLRAHIQLIFQDPYGSLNPRQRIGDMFDQLLCLHTPLNRAARLQHAQSMLDAVGLSPNALARFPHEFSGGQRQRIAIARALLLKPQVLICDEAVSALDVSIQAQILNLLVDLRDEFNLSYVFISHDLSVVRYISDRIMVMNNGRILENSRPDVLWNHPKTDYTRQLIHAIPNWNYDLELCA